MSKRLILIMLLLSLTGLQPSAAQTPEAEPVKPPSGSPTVPLSSANQTPPPPPAQVQPLPINEATGIMGRPVHSADGKDIGRIIDVIVDQNGHPRAAVIDFGGFLGLGNRKIAVDWGALHFAPGNQTAPVTLGLTPDQIKAAPEYREVGRAPPTVVAPPVPPPPVPPPPVPPPPVPPPPASPPAVLPDQGKPTGAANP